MQRQDKIVFVADENFDFSVIKMLRAKGFSVLAIAESFPSIPDTQVLQIASDRTAVLLTEDKDFGELVHRLRMPHCGILLVRLIKMSSAEKSQRIGEIIDSVDQELINSFSVLTNEHLRVRPAQPK